MNDGLTFWARRRAGVEAEARAEVWAEEQRVQDEINTQANEKTDAELLAELDLPDPESLKMGDDFSAFMSKAVPDRLRRRALRVLWRSNPVLANVDMLVDYGEDFTDSAMVVENLQTTYQVGKGMLAHIEKLAADAEAAAEADAEEPTDDADATLVEADTITVEQNTTWAETRVPEQNAAEDEDMHTAPAPRRMAFTFETGTA